MPCYNCIQFDIANLTHMDPAYNLKTLLKIIEQAPSEVVKSTNVFDNAVRIYMNIKTMYQKFKKHHILQLMQDTVFEVKNPPQRDARQCKRTQATAENIFEYNRLSQDDIIRLIEIKECLIESKNDELYEAIIAGINSLDDLTSVLNCYGALLLQQYKKCMNINFHIILEKMIKKLLFMDLKEKDFKTIAKKIYSLPIISQPILIFISHLYQKINQATYFAQLFTIFEKKFPSQPTIDDIGALLRICNEKTLASFMMIVAKNDETASVTLHIAERQAKHKLQHLSPQMTSKTIPILNFVVCVALHGREIWSQIIQWEIKASNWPKNYLKAILETYLIQIIKDPNQFNVALNIVQKLSTIKEQQSEIYLIVTRELFKLEDRQRLGNKIIKKFLACKVFKQYNSELVQLIFKDNLFFIDIVLEIFKLEVGPKQIINFFVQLVRTNNDCKQLDPFYRALSYHMPSKFKDLYLCWNRLDKLQNLACKATTQQFKRMNDYMTFDMAISIVRDLATQPSIHLNFFVNFFLVTFKQPKQASILRTQIIRTLNIILVGTPKMNMNQKFIIAFSEIIRNHLVNEKEKIFANVSQQIIGEFRKIYNQHLQNGNQGNHKKI